MAQNMSGKKWILLVAGSKDYENYRHQANVCGLYQIIKKHGIPDEQIVVMMYDDIANNPKNSKFNGQIISVIDNSNVYSGVPKDYTGKHLTADNFLAALQGDKSTHKKVIESGPNDHIYVYMSGLGQEGAFQFPDKPLLSQDLTKTIKSMHDGHKFSKMVIFMESDYSATMFTHLPKKVNVYALASCHENVQLLPADYNKERDVYISDQFSIAWLQHLNTADFATSTFLHLVETKQSKFLKENPQGPCPCQFGDTKIAHCHLSKFLQQ